MEETRPFVSWDLVHDFMVDVFVKYGVPEEDARICTDVLLESDRRGIESHGCNRFKPIYLDRIKNGTLLPKTEIEIVKDTPCTVVMDEKAGMIGISGTNARPSVAPTFGVEPMMGTNPLTFTMPTDEEFPFNFDCATSIIQNGKIEFYARQGKDTPAGLVVAKDGGTMTESATILKEMRAGNVALLPLGGLGEETGGYKGYGFTTIVEILSSALAGGPFMKALSGKDENGNNAMYHLGHFFFVINPAFFMGVDTFKKTAGDICRGLRNSTKAPGQERIYTAGEKEYMAWLDRKDKGVPVGESIQKEFIQLRDELGLTQYKFPFEK